MTYFYQGYFDFFALKWRVKLKKYTMDIVNGLAYLHFGRLNIQIVHRDIKLKNILVFGTKIKSSTCKIGDFGLAITNDITYTENFLNFL